MLRLSNDSCWSLKRSAGSSSYICVREPLGIRKSRSVKCLQDVDALPNSNQMFADKFAFVIPSIKLGTSDTAMQFVATSTSLNSCSKCFFDEISFIRAVDLLWSHRLTVLQWNADDARSEQRKAPVLRSSGPAVVMSHHINELTR